ncbi:MAG: hypothetical protein ACKOCK_05585 [Chloroflexota bacterium]
MNSRPLAYERNVIMRRTLLGLLASVAFRGGRQDVVAGCDCGPNEVCVSGGCLVAIEDACAAVGCAEGLQCRRGACVRTRRRRRRG